MTTKLTIPEIITHYRNQTNPPLSLRQMAEAITSVVQADGYSVSHATVANWEQGVYVPHRSTVLSMMSKSPPKEWVHSMGKDLLDALEVRTQQWN